MAGLIGIEVVYAECARAWRLTVMVDEGSSVAEVLARSAGRMLDWPEAALRPSAIAVFGREVGPGAVLHDGDRIELLRALRTDPKRARRARAATKTPR